MEATRSRPDFSSTVTRLAPGLLLALAAAAVAWTVQFIVPQLSALLVAILLGVGLTHVWTIPQRFAPGMRVAAKKLLRLGIVVLGLQLALKDVFGLGIGVLGVVVAIVTIGMLGTLVMGRWIGVPPSLAVLIACGFSICGAAAVAAVDGATDSDEEDVASAIGLVVLFGTLMIVICPLVLSLIGLNEATQGLVAGGAIHEVAQVVAAGGIIGGGALGVAVVVKLARVAMLAPVIFGLSLARRRTVGGSGGDGELPPLLPLFVAGFLLMAFLRTFVPLPGAVLDVGQVLQTVLLAAAMFALGCGVHISLLRKVGGRPVVLGAASTALVFTVSLVGMTALG